VPRRSKARRQVTFSHLYLRTGRGRSLSRSGGHGRGWTKSKRPRRHPPTSSYSRLSMAAKYVPCFPLGVLQAIARPLGASCPPGGGQTRGGEGRGEKRRREEERPPPPGSTHSASSATHTPRGSPAANPPDLSGHARRSRPSPQTFYTPNSRKRRRANHADEHAPQPSHRSCCCGGRRRDVGLIKC
jgi:hypothetical protein